MNDPLPHERMQIINGPVFHVQFSFAVAVCADLIS